MAQIDIFDTTLRDGEQSAGINLNTAEKIEIARQLERFGASIIEAGFPAASPGDFDAVQRIGDTMKNSIVTGLARSVKSDIDRVWEALKGAEQPHVHIFLATSPIHMEHKLLKTPDQVVDIAVESVKYARKFFRWSSGRRKMLPGRIRNFWLISSGKSLKQEQRRSIFPIQWDMPLLKNTARCSDMCKQMSRESKK